MLGYRTFFLLGVGALGLLSVATLLSRWLRPASSQIHFIVPDGFRGLFVLRVTAGVQPASRQGEGRFIYRIPPNGLLPIGENEPIFRWHQLSAQFDSSAPLETENELVTDAVKLYSLSTDQRGNSYYLVGTAIDKERFYRSMDRTLGRVVKN